MAQKPISTDNDVIRTSVSFPRDYYSKIEKIANDKRVSVAWVVREAVIEYIAINKNNKLTTEQPNE